MANRVPYTRERLTAAVAEGGEIDDMLRRLGKEPNRDTRRYLRKRLLAFGLLAPQRRLASVYTPEMLAEAAAASVSFAGVVRFLQLRQAGGTQAHIARRIRACGIDIGHFTGQAHNKGQRRPKLTPAQILTQRPSNAKRVPGCRLRQALRELGRLDVCAECGTGPIWRGKPLSLEVDHINGDWSDNRIENLRILCPNCHAITDTDCGRNKRRTMETTSHTLE
ncbi:hypothetical protein ABIA32_004458 [Streptacidiphilus sp. MAP12-20]|uniref:HNH endonuclease signature motif containing protein n=1 Tax=Streptacidiphilus sp. MAP12-20 TaxID=3156299 RepID=UPI00351591C7